MYEFVCYQYHAFEKQPILLKFTNYIYVLIMYLLNQMYDIILSVLLRSSCVTLHRANTQLAAGPIDVKILMKNTFLTLLRMFFSSTKSTC